MLPEELACTEELDAVVAGFWENNAKPGKNHLHDRERIREVHRGLYLEDRRLPLRRIDKAHSYGRIPMSVGQHNIHDQGVKCPRKQRGGQAVEGSLDVVLTGGRVAKAMWSQR